MDHISCKQNRSHLSYFEWQASANSLNVFFSCVHRTLKKIWSYTLFIPKHFSLFIQRLSEIFSALQKLIEMKHFDIWRRMKRVWRLRVHKRISDQAFIDPYPNPSLLTFNCKPSSITTKVLIFSLDRFHSNIWFSDTQKALLKSQIIFRLCLMARIFRK